jgi:hypothetical protein
VAIEFPASRIDGDETRTVEVSIESGTARIIGLDDLYLDRLRQATMSQHDGVEFHSALAVVAARYDDIDWAYVGGRIAEITQKEGPVGLSMKKIDALLRSRVRRALTSE